MPNENETQEGSKLFSVSVRQIIVGLFCAVAGGILDAVYQLISACYASGGHQCLQIDWSSVGTVAVISGIAYIKVRFFSNKEGKIGGKL